MSTSFQPSNQPSASSAGVSVGSALELNTMKVSETASVVFRQVSQVSEEDFTPVYGYEVIRDGVEIAGSYEWSRGGLRAALAKARSM